MRLLLLTAVMSALAGTARAEAQQAGVQGIITDSATAQPLTGATVVLARDAETVRTMRTDRNGLFQIEGLAPGDYLLRITTFGYLAYEESVTLERGQRLTANRGLRPAPVQLEGIAVAGPAGGAVRRELGRQTITAQDLRRLPTPVGGDMVGYLQTVPGVVTTGDRGGQLLIRGGTPSENMVLMDGMLIYQPFHITGFSSVFPEDLVASAEFFPGGFPPRYSGRVSSVLDVRMRDGDPNQRAVAGSLSPFLAEVVAEGPLQYEGGPYSFIASARHSLIEQTSPWLLGDEQPLSFSSYYFKFSSVGDDGASRCSLTALRSSDSGGLDPLDPGSRVGWTNSSVSGRCASLAGDLFIDARLGYTRVSNEAVSRGASDLSSTASRMFAEADASRTIGRVRLDFGAFSHLKDASYDLAELFSDQEKSSGFAGIGGYAEATVPVGERLQVLPGFTTTWYMQTYAPTFEPRLRASWQPRGMLGEELSGAVGLYSQPIAGITDRRDAGSIFTAWGRPPGDSQVKALHAQMSWQQGLGGGFSWSLDGYYRRIYDLPVTTWSTAATFTTELAPADGRVHGADTRVELRRGPFYGFASYGYSWTQYEPSDESFGEWFGEPITAYHPSHDRRHQANVLATLRLGRFTFASRWEMGTGFPFTQPIGFDELFDFRGTIPSVRESYGETRVILDRPFNARLPPTHRLDVSVERTVELWSRQIQLQAGAINAYGQTNMFYYDVFTNRRINQLPFAPYISVKLEPK